MVKKVVGAMALAGASVMGTAGAAWAAPPQGPNCTRAATRVVHLQQEQTRLENRITALQALNPQGRREVFRERREIAWLTRFERFVTTRIDRVETACPSTTTTTTSGGVVGIS